MSERLLAGWHPITVYEELGVAVSRSSFYRFLHRHALCELGDNARKRVVPEIIHQPGEALILDWGKLRDVTDPVSSLAKQVGEVVAKTAQMNEVDREIWARTEFAQIERVWGDKTGEKLALARQLVLEIERKQPGLVDYLNATGAGDSAMVIMQLGNQAELLQAKRTGNKPW